MEANPNLHPRDGNPGNPGAFSAHIQPTTEGSSEAHIIPAHQQETVPWRQEERSSTREDRMLNEVVVSLPPLLNDIDVDWSLFDGEEIRDTERLIAETDARYGHALHSLNTFLVRAESVASSQIESIEASAEDYALAITGNKSNSSASEMVAAGNALERLVASAGLNGEISSADIVNAQKVLLENDSTDGRLAGQWRPMQNWIGGSNSSPRNALYVPPPATTVPAYMDDVIRFVNRDGLSPLVQATVAHAQFESIHPFTDGNGRIGRALINAVLRRRGVTKTTVVPLASAIVADTASYFDALTAYRSGDVMPLLESFTTGANVAAAETQVTAQRLLELPDRWRSLVASRRGSIAQKLVTDLLATPTVDSAWVESRYEATAKSALDGISVLEEAGILREITGRKRNRVWASPDVMAELDDLNFRIGGHFR